MSVYYKKLIDLYEAGKINEWEICYTYKQMFSIKENIGEYRWKFRITSRIRRGGFWPAPLMSLFGILEIFFKIFSCGTMNECGVRHSISSPIPALV